MIVPNENDVLYGNELNHAHSGNERLRCLVLGRVHEYKAARMKDKREIARAIMSVVADIKPKGRFLRKNKTSNEWEIVSEKAALEKVRQTFYDAVGGRGKFDVGGARKSMQDETEQHYTKRPKTQHNLCQANLNLKASHDTSKLKLPPQSPRGMPFQSYPQQCPPYQQQQQQQPQQQTMEQQYQHGPNPRRNTVEENQRRQYEQQYAAWAQAAANGYSHPPPPHPAQASQQQQAQQQQQPAPPRFVSLRGIPRNQQLVHIVVAGSNNGNTEAAEQFPVIFTPISSKHAASAEHTTILDSNKNSAFNATDNESPDDNMSLTSCPTQANASCDSNMSKTVSTSNAELSQQEMQRELNSQGRKIRELTEELHEAKGANVKKDATIAGLTNVQVKLRQENERLRQQLNHENERFRSQLNQEEIYVESYKEKLEKLQQDMNKFIESHQMP